MPHTQPDDFVDLLIFAAVFAAIAFVIAVLVFSPRGDKGPSRCPDCTEDEKCEDCVWHWAIK